MPHTLAKAASIVIFTTLLTGCNMGQYEEPGYTLQQPAAENIELRAYAPKIVAQVTVSGERKEAISKGFKLIADYIFGNNTPNQSIDMTAPVLQQAVVKGEKIAMTTPVIQQPSAVENQWIVQFVMPHTYTLETLPKPVNSEVKLLATPAKTMAVIRFSGSSSDENLRTHREALERYIAAQKLKTIGEPVLAFYDPPWTLPFFRRNEIMVAIAPAGRVIPTK